MRPDDICVFPGVWYMRRSAASMQSSLLGMRGMRYGLGYRMRETVCRSLLAIVVGVHAVIVSGLDIEADGQCRHLSTACRRLNQTTLNTLA